jgi:urease accessory protein
MTAKLTSGRARILLGLAASCVATPVLAHAGHSHGVGDTGFVAGLLHPLSGWDHLVALLAAGVFAGRLGGSARLEVPLTFLGLVLLGALAAWSGLTIPLVEPVILLSVAALAAAAILGQRARSSLVAGVCACFGLFHGYAHALELVPGASALLYGVGFMLSMAAIMAVGVKAGDLISGKGTSQAAA